MQYLLSRFNDARAALIYGKHIANLAGMTALVLLGLNFFQGSARNTILLLAGLVIALATVLLLLTTTLPKLFVLRDPQRYAELLSFPLQAFLSFVKPVTFLLDLLTERMTRIFDISSNRFPLHQDELIALVDVSNERDTLEEDERQMITSIFEFRETLAKEIMVPRIDIVAVDKSTPLDELVSLIGARGHTRIPIFDGSIDSIIGVLHAKDLLNCLANRGEGFDLETLARPTVYVTESKKIDELLNELKSNRLHMAVVVDEYGGTAGLLTLEDILEEIVGEIQDEYDRELPPLRKVSEHAYIANARIDLDELNRDLSLNLPTEDGYETLGGFIFSMSGTVPEEKTRFMFEDIAFIIEKVEGNRILNVRVELPAHEKASPPPAIST